MDRCEQLVARAIQEKLSIRVVEDGVQLSCELCPSRLNLHSHSHVAVRFFPVERSSSGGCTFLK